MRMAPASGSAVACHAAGPTASTLCHHHHLVFVCIHYFTATFGSLSVFFFNHIISFGDKSEPDHMRPGFRPKDSDIINLFDHYRRGT